MRFFAQSKHGQELIIIFIGLMIVASLVVYKYYKTERYKTDQAACLSDCTEVGGNFRRYNSNSLSPDQCICIVNREIRNIWN